MIVMPMKFVPYFFIILGIFGAMFIISRGIFNSDTISGIAMCILFAIGGAIWAYIDIRRRQKDKEDWEYLNSQRDQEE